MLFRSHGNLRWVPTGTNGGTGGGGTAPGGGGGGVESGGGGGAAGWVLLRYLGSYAVTGTLSPDTTSGCAAISAM